ncbi:MAG: hypothetical protein HFH41_11850 [Lachnospiraceae bacterium]|nr:hypothetical protein [Lachnospiraceae bacterium]
MTIERILEQAGVPIVVFVFCMYFGIRLLVFQDIEAIRGKNKGVVRDQKGYAIAAGKLVLFFGVAALGMAALIFVNLYAALGEIILSTIVLGVLWKRMNDKYGA